MVPTSPKIKISPQVTNFLCEDVVSQMFPGASAVVVKSWGLTFSTDSPC